MKKRLLDLRSQEPLLNIVSYGRGGPRSLTRTQREQIARTVGRVPEVVVKVTGGARTLAGVERYMDYTGREGKLGLETDDGHRVDGRGFERALMEDWNLDLEAHQRQSKSSICGRIPPRLVRNIVFSMPPGTPPDKVLQAVRKVALDQFALRHRYAMVLHTDEPHPHVHVLVKSVSEQGKRLYISKATLREWRRLFAANLRELGVAANATERAVRGQPSTGKPDGIYRAAQRSDSTYMRELSRRAAASMSHESIVPEPGKATLLATRQAVVDGWRAVQNRLRDDGHGELADQVGRFVERMPPAKTEKERLIDQLRTRGRQIEPPHRTR